MWRVVRERCWRRGSGRSWFRSWRRFGLVFARICFELQFLLWEQRHGSTMVLGDASHLHTRVILASPPVLWRVCRLMLLWNYISRMHVPRTSRARPLIWRTGLHYSAGKRCIDYHTICLLEKQDPSLQIPHSMGLVIRNATQQGYPSVDTSACRSLVTPVHLATTSRPLL